MLACASVAYLDRDVDDADRLLQRVGAWPSVQTCLLNEDQPAGHLWAGSNPRAMLSALLMIRRLAVALRIALRDEDFARVLGAAMLLVILGTLTFTLSTDWSVADSLYVAVATLTTSSIMNPSLTIDDPWLEIFVAAYVLIGIGILVEVARRLGMGFIAAREEVRRGKDSTPSEPEDI